MSKVLIIDDSDPAITYTGNWATLSSVGVQTGEYNTTVHQSSTDGDQLSYTFEGTGITVYGTLGAPGLHGPPNASFSLDGQTSIGFNSTILRHDPNATSSYVPLYHSPSLMIGTHTLVVSSGTPTNVSALLYVDFLTVETGSDSTSGNIIVDDRDASIKYVGKWRDAGAPWEYELTTKGAPNNVVGGTATFRFNGTSITVYGTTTFSNGPNTTAAISFAIDGGPSSQFNAPQNSNVIQHNPLFHAGGLSNTQEHSIVMTSLNKNSWWLDYMVYTTRNSSIAGGGGGSSVTGPGTGPSGPETGPSGGGGGGGEGPNVSAVAGGVAAGVVALLAIAGIIFIHLWRRNRNRKANEEFHDKSVTAGTGSHFGPSSFTPAATGSHADANPLPSKWHDSNSSYAPASGAGDRVGQALRDSSASTAYLGTQFTLSTSQYSDGESQLALTPAVAGPEYGHQIPNNPLYPRFDRSAGEGIISMYQRDGRRTMVNTHRPPPSNVPTIEEDSGVRIPARTPQVYTPD